MWNKILHITRVGGSIPHIPPPLRIRTWLYLKNIHLQSIINYILEYLTFGPTFAEKKSFFYLISIAVL